jgi:hypothetical protein
MSRAVRKKTPSYPMLLGGIEPSTLSVVKGSKYTGWRKPLWLQQLWDQMPFGFNDKLKTWHQTIQKKMGEQKAQIEPLAQMWVILGGSGLCRFLCL